MGYAARYVVTLTDADVSCKWPTGKIETVRWDDLQSVHIKTSSGGPMMPDVFWILRGSQSVCIIIQGATGEEALLERLQKLTGFDNNAVIDAMTSVEDREFLCWQRKGE